MADMAGKSTAMEADMAQPAETEDELLVRRFAEGDLSVFDHIVERHQQRVAKLAWRLLGWTDEAEDVVQDVFLAAYKKLADFRGQASLGSWLTAITINKCRTWRRKRLLRWKIHSAAQLDNHTCTDENHERTFDQETCNQLRRTIQILPAKLREVVILRYLEEMPIAEMTAVLNVTENTVHVRLNRARTRLREHLGNLFEE
ncbi:MAG: ECF RNA polymerase sigma factor SigW [Planctomycetes bacterium ADurb.Bin412]|jgi:RNA polymerase sigma-70 factor (ECF subfamily)|nr:MAG: ECF RNA polymerase sigma factor SigW [Planctomycetes bacterium ADurb.Bin412]